MTHKRIRKFNTKDTYPEQNLNNDLCQAVVTEGGKTVWMRGQCPQNLDDGSNIESLDPAEQTHKVMKNIKHSFGYLVLDLFLLVALGTLTSKGKHCSSAIRSINRRIASDIDRPIASSAAAASNCKHRSS